MRFNSILFAVASLPALSIAAKNSAVTIVQSLNTLTSQCQIIQSTVEQFGSSTQVTSSQEIITSITKVTTSIKQQIAVLGSVTGNVQVEEQTEIVTALQEFTQVSESIFSSISGQAAVFTQAGYSSNIQTTLTTFESTARGLCTVIGGLVPAVNPTVLDLQVSLRARINAAIAALVHVSANINLPLNLKANVKAGLGAGLNANLGLGADIGVNL